MSKFEVVLSLSNYDGMPLATRVEAESYDYFDDRVQFLVGSEVVTEIARPYVVAVIREPDTDTPEVEDDKAESEVAQPTA